MQFMNKHPDTHCKYKELLMHIKKIIDASMKLSKRDNSLKPLL